MLLSLPGSVLHPLISIFLMQSVITMAIYSLSVIMPVAAADLRVPPESVGYYVSVIYASSTVVGLFSGQLVARHGALTLFRSMLLLTAAAVLLLVLVATPLALITMAFFVGAASGPMNPTGSQVLARVTPDSQRALVFSLKQCATPAGGVLAGIALPTIMLATNWQVSMTVVIGLALLFALLASFPEPDSVTVGSSSSSSNRFSLRKTFASITQVWEQPDLRSLTIAAVGLAAAQMALTTYLVVYLWREVGFTEAAAGLVFAGLHISGISARVVLGLIADRLTSARTLMVCLCVVLAVALLLVSQFSEHWSLVVVYVVVFAAGGSGNGWVGLYYAEIARLTPVEQVAEITGASQFFTYIGLLVGPVVFAALLSLTDSFRVTFLFFSAMILLAGLALAHAMRQSR